MINLELVGGAELASKLDRFPAKLHDELKTSLGVLALKLARNVRTKLNGPVLKRRTGALWQSIGDAVTDDGGRLAGVVSVAGDAQAKGRKVIDYARAHEYGFQGTVTVKEHMREIKQAFGHAIAPKKITVRSHPMKMNLPERSFLRSSLREMNESGQVATEMSAAIERAKQ